MKPSDKQKKVARAIELQAMFWQQTNDINSPTHYNDIEESFGILGMDDIINSEEEERLIDAVSELYDIVKSLK